MTTTTPPPSKTSAVDSFSTTPTPFDVNVSLKRGQHAGAYSIDLCKHSKIFENLLVDKQRTESDGGGTKVKTLNVPSMTLQMFSTLNKFFSAGRLPSEISLEECLKLIGSAQEYEIWIFKDQLIEKVKEFCRRSDAGDVNVFRVLKFAKDNNVTELRSYTLDVISNAPDRFFNTNGFCQLEVPDICDILRREDLKVRDEAEVFHAALGWVQLQSQNANNRQYYFLMVLPLIRFQCIDPERIPDLIKKYKEVLPDRTIEVVNCILTSLLKNNEIPVELLKYNGIKWRPRRGIQNANKMDHVNNDLKKRDSVEVKTSDVRTGCISDGNEAPSSSSESVIRVGGGEESLLSSGSGVPSIGDMEPSSSITDALGAEGRRRESRKRPYCEEENCNNTAYVTRDVKRECEKAMPDAGANRNDKTSQDNENDCQVIMEIVLDEEEVGNTVNVTCPSNGPRFVQDDQPISNTDLAFSSSLPNELDNVPHKVAASARVENNAQGVMTGRGNGEMLESMDNQSVSDENGTPSCGSSSSEDETLDDSDNHSDDSLYYFVLTKPRNKELFTDFSKLVRRSVHCKNPEGADIDGVDLNGFKLENIHKLVKVRENANITVNGEIDSIKGESVDTLAREQSLLDFVRNFDVLAFLTFMPENRENAPVLVGNIWELHQNILLQFNGIIFLRAQHKDNKALVLHYLRQSREILNGCGDDVESIGVCNCEFNLDSVRSYNLTKLVLYRVWGAFEIDAMLKKFPRLEVLCLWKFKPDNFFDHLTLELRFSDKNFPFRSLKELVLARVELVDFNCSKATNVEILRLEDCCVKPGKQKFIICEEFPKIFPKLKRIFLMGFEENVGESVHDVTSVHSVYGALKIPSLEHIRVDRLRWRDITKVKCDCNCHQDLKQKTFDGEMLTNFFMERSESPNSSSSTEIDGWNLVYYEKQTKGNEEIILSYTVKVTIPRGDVEPPSSSLSVDQHTGYYDMCDAHEYKWHHLNMFFRDVVAYQNYFIHAESREKKFPKPQHVFWI